MDPWMQSARDKAAHQERREAQLRKEKRADNRNSVLWLLAIAVFFFLGYKTISDSNEERAATNEKVQAKYKKWVSYRDANCKVGEKVYGLPRGSGKSVFRDNTVTYDCSDGVKYVIAESEEKLIRSGMGELHFIPDVK